MTHDSTTRTADGFQIEITVLKRHPDGKRAGLHAKILDKRGPTAHHVGSAVRDTLEELEAWAGETIRRLSG